MSRWAESARRTVATDIRSARHDDGVIVIGLFVGTILVNGILAIVLIEFMEWLGLWSQLTEAEPSTRMDSARAAGHSDD